MTKELFVKTLEENGFNETMFTCEDGTKAYVTPCGYREVHCINECEYFLFNWDFYTVGSDDADEIIKMLNNHKKLREEYDADVRKLRDYFDKHQESGWDSDSFSFFSDWHKDVKGHRPRGCAFGIPFSEKGKDAMSA